MGPNHKTSEEEEFDLPPLFQMNDSVLSISIKYARRELATVERQGGDVGRVLRKISLLEKELGKRSSP